MCSSFVIRNTQLAESLRVWYVFRDKVKDNLGDKLKNYYLQDSIWWNRKVRLKTKKFFFYQDWYDHGIRTLNDLYLGRNFVKSFEDLVLEYDISIRDRRKYNYLMNGILIDWFYNTRNIQENVYDNIVASLFENSKVTKYSDSIFNVQESPTNTGCIEY